MDGVKTETTNEEKEKLAITSEAKTLKALCYLQLLRIFAPAYDANPDAPGVILKSQLGIESKQRSSIRECVVKIKEWLTDAAQVNNTSSRNGWCED
jgi:starch-binding outer membrane protein, SusD/RagB family